MNDEEQGSVPDNPKSAFAPPKTEVVETQALTSEYVTRKIISCGERFREDVGVTPFDVCLGPAEFALLYQEYRQHTSAGTTPDWHYKVSHLWYLGMRLRLMNSPGILVGVLESRGIRGSAPFAGRGNDNQPVAPVSPKESSALSIARDWEAKFNTLNTVHNVFVTAIRKAIGMESPCPINDILDHVTALSQHHRETFKWKADVAAAVAQAKEEDKIVERYDFFLMHIRNCCSIAVNGNTINAVGLMTEIDDFRKKALELKEPATESNLSPTIQDLLDWLNKRGPSYVATVLDVKDFLSEHSNAAGAAPSERLCDTRKCVSCGKERWAHFPSDHPFGYKS